MPPMPPGEHNFGAQMPPISEMLLREANAWTALLQLNGSIAGAAHAASTHDDGLEYDEARETAAQREASYIGALSNLAALADALTNETLKLRSLRKARYQVTSMALQEVMREHANGALALGEGLARHSAVDLTTATALVRARQQDTRAQLAQARSLLQAMSECGTGAGPLLPAGARIVIGVRERVGGDGHDSHGGAEGAAAATVDRCRPVEEVLADAYASGGRITDASLAAALFGAAPVAHAAPPTTYRRRGGGTGAAPNSAAEPPAPAPATAPAAPAPAPAPAPARASTPTGDGAGDGDATEPRWTPPPSRSPPNR